MKKILLALLALSAASFAFAAADAPADKAKCDAVCTKPCCSKDAKACCTEAKDVKACADAKPAAKPAETAVKK